MAGFWDSEEILGKITKNSREEIHVKKVKKNGRKYLDIRTFWYDESSDEFKPSQKGIALPYEKVNELRKIIEGIENI